MEDLKGTPLNLKDQIAYAEGAVVSKTLLKKETGNISLFSFATGQGLSEHKAPFDATVLVVEGQGNFVIGGEPHIVREGEMLIMPADIPHEVKPAEQPFKMLLTMIRSVD